MGFIPFPKVLVQCEFNQSSPGFEHVSSSISYDDNHYTTGFYSVMVQFELEKLQSRIRLCYMFICVADNHTHNQVIPNMWANPQPQYYRRFNGFGHGILTHKLVYTKIL